LGEFELAKEQSTESVAIRRELPLAIDLADSLNLLGIALHDLLDYANAEISYRSALEITIELADSVSLDEKVNGVRNNLALLLSDQGRFDDAAVHYRQILESDRRILAGDSVDLAITLNNLANAIREMRKWNEAIPLYEESLQILRKKNHAYQLNVLNNYAQLLCEKSDFKAADRHYIDSIEFGARTRPAPDVDLANARYGFANCLAKQNRIREAKSYLLEAIPYVSPRIQSAADNLLIRLAETES
jgi:tetratricopeptide (TPR) repeat protein